MEKEIVKQDDVRAVTTLPVEQSVVLVGCMNPRVIGSVESAAKEQGVEVVRLSDKVVADYLKVKGKRVADATETTLGAFLADASNRVTAEQQATKLWTVMTGSTRVEEAEGMTFTETQVVRRTNLSHKTANELFNLLRAFGLLEWTNVKKREFTLHFFKKYIHAAIENDVLAMSKATGSDVLRYKKSLEGDVNLTPEEREAKLVALKEAVLSGLNF